MHSVMACVGIDAYKSKSIELREHSHLQDLGKFLLSVLEYG